MAQSSVLEEEEPAQGLLWQVYLPEFEASFHYLVLIGLLYKA